MPQTTEPCVLISPPLQPEPVPACHRDPGSPADQALTVIVDILGDHGYDFSIPSWTGDAYLRISNALQAVAELTITSRGNVTWYYLSSRYPHASERGLISIAIELLDPDHARPAPALPSDLHLTPLGAVRRALTSSGFAAAIIPTGDDTGPLLTAANTACPVRGTILVSGDGELQWNTRAPHHPDGGIPLPDIATTITRALTRAEHPAIPHKPEEDPA